MRSIQKLCDVVDDCYLVNLPKNTNKLEAAKTQLSYMGLTPTFIKGIEGSNVTDNQIGGEWMNIGQIGCAATHLDIWKSIAQSTAEWSLVFEDDAVWHEAARGIFPIYWSLVPEDAGFVYVGHSGELVNGQYNEYVINKVENCTHCYMMTPQYAAKFLEELKPCNRPIDSMIWWTYKDNPQGIYCFNDTLIPSNLGLFGGGLCFQDRVNFSSDIWPNV
jgi:GR25 family glycosyltransferase involved in LPS biosynthesis